MTRFLTRPNNRLIKVRSRTQHTLTFQPSQIRGLVVARPALKKEEGPKVPSVSRPGQKKGNTMPATAVYLATVAAIYLAIAATPSFITMPKVDAFISSLASVFCLTYCRAHRVSVFYLIYYRAHMISVFCLIYYRAHMVSVFCLTYYSAHRISMFCYVPYFLGFALVFLLPTLF
ncbi:unnamed protein product [Prunus armeniaca]